MHENIVYAVHRIQQQKFKFRFYEFSRIFKNLLTNYNFFSRPLPTKAPPMPTPLKMVTTVTNKMGTA